MGRSPNLLRRQELLDEAVLYVRANGLAKLSLRPLANALDISTFTLSYHFGSKGELLDAISEELAKGDSMALESLSLRSTADQLHAQWEQARTAAGREQAQLLHEQLALAGRSDIELEGVRQRLDAPREAITARLVDDSLSPEHCTSDGTILAAAMHGLIADYGVNNDNDGRISAAIERMIEVFCPPDNVCDLPVSVDEKATTHSRQAFPA